MDKKRWIVILSVIFNMGLALFLLNYFTVPSTATPVVAQVKTDSTPIQTISISDVSIPSIAQSDSQYYRPSALHIQFSDPPSHIYAIDGFENEDPRSF